MKRKIRGAVYDTDTANEIARWPGELDEIEDCLYRTKSGKYFTVEVNTYLLPEEPYQITPLSRREAIFLASEVTWRASPPGASRTSARRCGAPACRRRPSPTSTRRRSSPSRGGGRGL